MEATLVGRVGRDVVDVIGWVGSGWDAGRKGWIRILIDWKGWIRTEGLEGMKGRG